ncbi:MAG: type II toxin-antitoxin system RelE/ParE family toxin [Ignavibacteriales bacterium]|nr:type II toxin-antitoxin system RelE/ParE family toxin [Ignavibacteriales bacterium]
MVIWSIPAKEALRQIHDFIGNDSEFYSQKVVDDIILATEQIELFPNSGRIVPELSDEKIREIFIYSYRIIYEISSDDVTILNIVHGARNFKELIT